jgi:cysteine-rich repeat protein
MTAHHRTLVRLLRATLSLLFAIGDGAAPAASACLGDCNGNGTVQASEITVLISRINFCDGDCDALPCGLAPTSPPMCCGADRPPQNGSISASELAESIRNVNLGCPDEATPAVTSTATPAETPTSEATASPTASAEPSATPTGEPSPTATPTPTATPAMPAVCGNGVIEQGETCDDGNTNTGDTCPPDCAVEICTAAGTVKVVSVTFAPPAGANVGSLTVLLEYPDGTVQIPGSGGDPSVGARITNRPSGFLVDGVDLNYALRVAVAGSRALTVGQLFRVNFDICQGAIPPEIADFRCTVEDAFNTAFNPVPGVTCAVSFP